MKLLVYSDLHTDINNIKTPKDIFDNNEIYDYYLDAGDTGELDATLNFYTHPFWYSKKVITVPGNHTYYQTNMENTNYIFSTYTDDNLRILNNKEVVLNDKWSVLGATLWTDFNIFGESNNLFCKNSALKSMNDYLCINTDKGYFKPYMAEELFNETIKFLNEKLAQDKNFIILTHHTPSLLSSAQIYRNRFETSAYCSNLETFILDHPNIKYWIHGHCHNPSDYYIGDTRIICNPYGYSCYSENRMFKNNLFLEI